MMKIYKIGYRHSYRNNGGKNDLGYFTTREKAFEILKNYARTKCGSLYDMQQCEAWDGKESLVTQDDDVNYRFYPVFEIEVKE